MIASSPVGAGAVDRLRDAIGSVVHGKQEVVDLALATILAGGHLLVEDVPGVGKTTLASALAKAIGGSFSRVQLTADLLPSDITGCNILDSQTGRLSFRPGPVFANVVMADELNRTSPKTQSALFEAMEEARVTVDGETRLLPRPFFVVATQNPHDHHGTFPLPESQLDRFLMRVSIGYPDRESERTVLRRRSLRAELDAAVVTPDELESLSARAMAVAFAAEVEDWLLDVVRATREDARLLRGASTRGAQALHRAARARAFVAGRDYVVPDDIFELAVPVLAHRVVARIDGGPGGEGAQKAIRAIVESVPLPE